MSLKVRIQDDVKNAMRARDKARLGVLRLITAAIKQKEVDERAELDDTSVLAVLDKMAKQRRESIEQYEAAAREDLAEQERFELELLQDLGYFPDISHAADSGRDIAADTFYQFVIDGGFVECAESAPNATPGRVILDGAAGNYENPAVARLAKSVLRSSIDFNLHGKTLKSRDVYIKMMRRR